MFSATRGSVEMSGLAAIIIGLGIGFLIGLPALVAYRHDIASRFRRFWKPTDESVEQEHEREPSSKQSDGDGEGLSPAIAAFAIGAGAITALYGAFSGGVAFLASGAFLILGVMVAIIATRAVKD